jgi:HK97 gp10 family phage protein
MATGFSFKVQGLDKLIKVFDQLPKSVQSELSNELDATAGEIRDGAKRDSPVDEARVRNSISSKKISAMQFETVAQSFYAGYLEFGTKTKVSVPAGLEDVAASLKGPVGGQGNPIDALQGWVKRKGLAGTLGAKNRNKANRERQVAFLIWRHIKKFGIKAQPYFFKQMEPAEQRLRQRLANIIKSLIE